MAKRGGSGSRQRSKERRAAERRKIKSANKAHYASLAGTSANVKKKNRSIKKLRGFNSTKHLHLISDCGNPGCSKCEHLHVNK